MTNDCWKNPLLGGEVKQRRGFIMEEKNIKIKESKFGREFIDFFCEQNQLNE